MRERKHHNQAIAAARAGMSERTARRHEKDPRKPSERRPARGRTVPDPLAAVWESELVPMLETDPSLKPITLLHYLMRSYPESFPDQAVRRTLERRVRDWKALRGPRREVIFRQRQAPGRQALSDFTDAGQLGVTIAGAFLVNAEHLEDEVGHRRRAIGYREIIQLKRLYKVSCVFHLIATSAFA